MTPWYETEAGKARLLSDHGAMAAQFPHFRLFEQPDGALAWAGRLTSDGGREYDVVVRVTSNYPASNPDAYITDLPTGARWHVDSRGKLDLVHQSTGASVLDVACLTAIWIFNYEAWRGGNR